MPYFAVMGKLDENNKTTVNTCIVADTLEDANETVRLANLGSFCIEYDQNSSNAPGVGYTWDGTKFIDPFSLENIKILEGGE